MKTAIKKKTQEKKFNVLNKQAHIPMHTRGLASYDRVSIRQALSNSILQPKLTKMMALHQTIGNRAVGHFIQAKLKIGVPNDKYEKEADQVAELVMRMPEPHIQRQLMPEEEEGEEIIQRKPLTSANSSLIQPQGEETVLEEEEAKKGSLQTKRFPGHDPSAKPQIAANINALRSGGQQLPKSVRAFFESRFGVDFSGVRVHFSPQATETAKAMNARAYTVGQNIVFGNGQYKPETDEGRRLLSHELTHVVQQRYNNIPLQRKVTYEEYKQDQKAREEALEEGIKQNISERLFSNKEITFIKGLEKLYPPEAPGKEKDELFTKVKRKLSQIAENANIDLENYKKAEGRYVKWGYHYQKNDDENSAVELLFFDAIKGLLRYDLRQEKKKEIKKRIKKRIFYDAKGNIIKKLKNKGKIEKYEKVKRNKIKRQFRQEYIDEFQKGSKQTLREFTAKQSAESGLPDIWELTEEKYIQSENPKVGAGKELAGAFNKILEKGIYDEKLGTYHLKKNKLTFDKVWQQNELARLQLILKKLKEIQSKKKGELKLIRNKQIKEINSLESAELDKLKEDKQDEFDALDANTELRSKSKRSKRKIINAAYKKKKNKIISKYREIRKEKKKEYMAKEKEFRESQLNKEIKSIKGLIGWIKNKANTELKRTKAALENEANYWNNTLVNEDINPDENTKSKKPLALESTAERFRRITAAKLCNVISYYLFLRATGKTSLTLSEYYLQEVKRGRIGVEVTHTKVSAPFFGWGTESLREHHQLKQIRKNKKTKLTADQISMFLSSNAKVAISFQDIGGKKVGTHFFLIVKDQNGVWRNMDHTSKNYNLRGGETNFDKVYALIFDENALKKEGKEMAKKVQQSEDEGSFVDNIISNVIY